jgi:alpha-N-arabinofuranosidase
MSGICRRQFLSRVGIGAATLTAHLSVDRAAHFQTGTSSRARVIVDPARPVASLDRRLFGSFVEHIGRCIYGGIYEPGSKLSDSDGFRKDVLAEVRQLGVPIIRYPGGNFVSGYNWLDGVGPKKDRPRVLNLASNSIESNQFGTNEFLTWCRAVGTEPLLAVNLGTGTPERAANLVEYCNVEGGTRWSDLRRQHGFEKPYKIKYWCLGNEMDGPWQLGHIPAKEYGLKARDAALQMRTVDPSIKLVACGSSEVGMPTYLEWDRQTLEESYDDVDAISLHHYFGNGPDTGGDSSKFLAANLTMDRQIEEVKAVCDMVRGRKRSKKQLWLSFDEWNVWYRKNTEADMNGQGKEAPHLVEEVYNLEDALVVGGLIITLLRHSDRVRLACLAQLVNDIAPLVTNPDRLLRQPIYYPYAWALKYGHGNSLNLAVESEAYEVPEIGTVPYVDMAATFDPASGSTALFMLNRDLVKTRELEVIWRDGTPTRVEECQVMTGADLKAYNSFEAPTRVIPQPLDRPKAGAHMIFELPAHSYSVANLPGRG